MSLILPKKYIKTEERDNGLVDNVLYCGSGVNDKLKIWRDGYRANASIGFYIENEDGDMSTTVYVKQEALPELIDLLQFYCN